MIIASSLHHLLLTEHAARKWTGRSAVEVSIEDERFTVGGVNVVVKTLNLEISRCHLADYTSKNCVKVFAARAARLFFLVRPMRSLFSGVVIAFAVVFA